MSGKIAIGVSACLLGEKVRYDGGHKHDPYITGVLGGMFTLMPVCPEAECGMGIPREPMRLEGDPANSRLVTIEGHRDMTERMLSYCHAKLGELERMDLCGFILKARSPSCGLSVDVYVSGTPAGKGRGLFAAALLEHFPHLPVVEEGGLGNPEARADFIARVFACHRTNRRSIFASKRKSSKGGTTMPDLKGTKTEGNLKAAFAGESQARNKYTYFASVAKKEGYEKIAAIFLETADNEREHAKLHLKKLGGIGSTMDNLAAAAAGEMDEFMEMYPRMAREAREEGFPEIAALFEAIAEIEKAHQERYRILLEELEAGLFFKRDEPARWRCRNCGHIHEGPEAPDTCPVCNHPQAYFELIEGRL